jgi:hypothetical protein
MLVRFLTLFCLTLEPSLPDRKIVPFSMLGLAYAVELGFFLWAWWWSVARKSV